MKAQETDKRLQIFGIFFPFLFPEKEGTCKTQQEEKMVIRSHWDFVIKGNNLLNNIVTTAMICDENEEVTSPCKTM